MTYYKYHIFLCTNQRSLAETCCNNAGATEILGYAKEQIKLLGMGMSRVRVSMSGCLGLCKKGPVLVIYPDAIWYTYRTKEDIDEILCSLVRNDGIVKRLCLNNRG